MANSLYTTAVNEFLNGTMDWTNDNHSAFFVDHADDTPVVATDQYVNPGIGAAAQVPAFASAPALTGESTSGRTADATDLTFTSLSGDQSESLNIFEDSGVDTTSPLVVYIDTATGLPLTPNGANVDVTWDTYIFAL